MSLYHVECTWAGPDSAAVLYPRLCQLFLVSDPCAASAGAVDRRTRSSATSTVCTVHVGGLLYFALYVLLRKLVRT